MLAEIAVWDIFEGQNEHLQMAKAVKHWHRKLKLLWANDGQEFCVFLSCSPITRLVSSFSSVVPKVLKAVRNTRALLVHGSD